MQNKSLYRINTTSNSSTAFSASDDITESATSTTSSNTTTSSIRATTTKVLKEHTSTRAEKSNIPTDEREDPQYFKRVDTDLLSSTYRSQRGREHYDDFITLASTMLQTSEFSQSWIDHHKGRTCNITVFFDQYYDRRTYT